MTSSYLFYEPISFPTNVLKIFTQPSGMISKLFEQCHQKLVPYNSYHNHFHGSLRQFLLLRRKHPGLLMIARAFKKYQNKTITIRKSKRVKMAIIKDLWRDSYKNSPPFIHSGYIQRPHSECLKLQIVMNPKYTICSYTYLWYSLT